MSRNYSVNGHEPQSHNRPTPEMAARIAAAVRHIATWDELLRQKGFANNINPAHWNGQWRSRKHVVVNGEGRILEITFRDTYVRIFYDPSASPETPFGFLSFRSEEDPDRPKTAYHCQPDKKPTYMDQDGILANLADLEFGVQ